MIPLAPLWKQYKRVIKPNGAIVLTSQIPFAITLGNSNLPWLRYEWIWEKNRPTGFLNARRMLLKQHENILVFYKHLPVYNPRGVILHDTPTHCRHGASSNYGRYGEKYDCTAHNFPRDIQRISTDSDHEHPTQKPVALFEYLIRTYTNEGATVLDNAIGSGTTAIACIRSNRHYIGFETSQRYYDNCIARIEAYRSNEVSDD